MAMPSPWVKFPFSHPDSFQKMLTMLDTTTILNCRAVCIDWRNWITFSQTVWARVLPRVVTRVFSRRVRMELEQNMSMHGKPSKLANHYKEVKIFSIYSKPSKPVNQQYMNRKKSIVCLVNLVNL